MVTDARPTLLREDSFRRLAGPIRFLVSCPADRREELLAVLFRWPPTYVEETVRGQRLHLVVAPLKVFQVLELLDRGATIHYQTTSGAFAPWGFDLVSSLPAGTVVDEDGSTSLVWDEKSGAEPAVIHPLLPHMRLVSPEAVARLSVPVGLERCPLGRTVLHWFDLADLPDLIRSLDLDRPRPDDPALHAASFRWVATPLRSIVAVALGSLEHAELARSLAERARRSFVAHFRDCVFVETGWTLCPQLPNDVLRSVFDPSCLHLMWMDGDRVERLVLTQSSSRSYPLSSLGGLLLALHRDAVNRFTGGRLRRAPERVTMPAEPSSNLGNTAPPLPEVQ